jgi:cardiolipin synthase
MPLPPVPSLLPGPAPVMVDGNRLELVANAEQRLERYLAMLAEAKVSIDIIIYVFEPDSAGETVRAALVAAAQRGVRVRMVVDSFGSNLTSDDFFEPIRAAGGSVIFFSRRWRTSYLIRNHQKMLIVDDERLMFGGFNIAESYFVTPRIDCWTDLGLVLTGPATSAMVDWFEQLHLFTQTNDGKWLKLRRMMRDWQLSHQPRGPLQWLVGGPTQRMSPWARAIRTDLSIARRIDMVMAYFSPGQGMLRRLGRAARRGPVRLITAARSDNGATIGAARLLYRYLLRKRLQVMEYQPQRLHMKLIVADDAVYIGSANFDMRSLFVNLELMLRVEDASFAGQALAIVDQLAEASEPITREWIEKRVGWLTRVRWTLSWVVVSIIDYSVVRRLNFGLETDPDSDGIRPTPTPGL